MSRGRLRVAAGIGFLGDAYNRASALMEAGVDVLVVDTANGEAKLALDMIRRLKSDSAFNGVDIIGGNVATRQGAQAMIDAGVDAVKVGVGPAPSAPPAWSPVSASRSSPPCTRGRPGLPRRWRAVHRRRWHPLLRRHRQGLVAGASSVMLGGTLAGCEEAPGEKVLLHGKQYKLYRGMGSLGAMAPRGKKSYSRTVTSRPTSPPTTRSFRKVSKAKCRTADRSTPCCTR